MKIFTNSKRWNVQSQASARIRESPGYRIMSILEAKLELINNYFLKFRCGAKSNIRKAKKLNKETLNLAE